MLAALRSAVHVRLGFGGFNDYIERLFGYKPRTTREKLRVAEALEGRPAFADALNRGTLSWCAVRELVRVAVTETEQTWLEVARGKTLRELEGVRATRWCFVSVRSAAPARSSATASSYPWNRRSSRRRAATRRRCPCRRTT